MKRMSILFIMFSLFSCGNDDFKEYFELKEFRILAIKADLPEINSSTSTVTLTPVMSHPEGGDRTIDINWTACPDPGIDYGAEINCDGASDALTESGTGTFNTSSLSGTYYTGAMINFSVNIPAAAFSLFPSLNERDQFNGYDYVVIFTFTDQADGKKTRAIKRIRLSTKANGDLNTNPSFSGIQSDNNSLSAFPSSTSDFSLDSASGPESYEFKTFEGTRTLQENMTTTWFSSEGEFKFSRTLKSESNEFDPDGADSGVFVAVYRDNRGGLSVEVISF